MSIKVNRVSHSYYKKTPNEVLALDNVSLNIEDGSFVALVGETGSGKSTLVQHLNALLLPDNGTIDVNETIRSIVTQSFFLARYTCFHYAGCKAIHCAIPSSQQR